MPLQLEEMAEGKVIGAHLSGKLTGEDYKRLTPEIERMISRHGRIRMLADMHDFHGWSARAFWEEVKMDAKHFNHIERAAIVGEAKWQEWMTKFCRPFTTAKVRYFDQSQMDQARAWIQAN